MTEVTKEQLLKAGLKILDTTGRSSLKISNLCSSLKLTKGSFYHWFKSKKEFDLNLLTYWRELFTRQFIKDANFGQNSKEKLVRLIKICIESIKVNSRLEIEINMWARQDTVIGEFIEEVYKERFNYLLNLFEDIYQNKKEAKRHALILSSLVIGVDLFYQKLTKQEMELIFKEYLS
ncbi:MAG: TetR/AcrR family transcriptional regulator [Colwellia sp.]|nr:TetR/AcrR family transcriptional regulator [Colwellia sp.]